ncbi:microtubule-associated tyrosine carboxypeptidase 1 isoform 4-T7 [Liasis olivaceus]
MVLDSPAYHPPLHPEVFHADPQLKRGGKKKECPPGTRVRQDPLLSHLSLESDASGPGGRTRVLKPLCGLDARPPARACLAFQGPCSWMHRSESSCAVNRKDWARGQIRSAASLPYLPKARTEEGAHTAGKRSPCLLVALRPANLEAERERFFRSSCSYNPQFEYGESVPGAVLEKYKECSGQFLPQVVVQLTEDLLSQAVMMVENSRPTLAINLSGARQNWLEGMLRHEIGTHYIRGVNNTYQPWHSMEGRKQYSLKPANPTEEGLASLHSVLFRKQPFLWRAALLYYTVCQAGHMSFCELFHDLGRYVQDAGVRWEYCVRAKRGQADTSLPGCFSKDQVYLEGILQILRHRQTIDFRLLAALGKVSYEDVDHLKKYGVLEKARIPHFMQDLERYMQQLNHIVTTNCLNDEELERLMPE